jgi:ABC-type amino acid transport substrate-binding protein
VTDVWRSSVVGVGMRKEDEDLVSEINRYLATLKQEHFLDQLEKKWF